MEFTESGKELTFTFRFRGLHFGAKAAEGFPLEGRATEVPVQYTPDEWTDIYMRPHAEDADASVAKWAKAFRGR